MDANLQALLINTDLQGAVFWGANLQGANLREAKLRDAQGLTPDQIRSAESWESAIFSDDLRETLGLPPNDPAEKSP